MPTSLCGGQDSSKQDPAAHEGQGKDWHLFSLQHWGRGMHTRAHTHADLILKNHLKVYSFLFEFVTDLFKHDQIFFPFPYKVDFSITKSNKSLEL